jgi:CRP-like cAMP-binding protein
MRGLKEFYNQLSPISENAWNDFSKLFISTTLNKGEYFIREGETADEIGFLEKGIMRAFYRNTEGTEYNKHFFINPSFIGGYASLINKMPNQINQEALTECTIRVAKYAEVEKLFEKHSELERAARRLAELFFVQKEMREIEIVLLDAEKRYQIFRNQYPGLEQQIAQYHIASYLGITPTQLSRIRKKRNK